MDWRDDILRGFPSPRDDEPASLRRDIEDELADHLACALSRERTTAEDEQAARRAVLVRFGNPRLVAYKLYWDAMKGKIMKDRLMIAASILMMLTCVLAVGALWLTLKESREVNAALLAQISKMAAAQPAMPPNQGQIKIKLTTPDGKPVAGKIFKFFGAPFKEGNHESIDLTTDQQGIATVGPIQSGHYRASIEGKWTAWTEMTLFNGQTLEKTIICPADLNSNVEEFALKIDWPREVIQSMNFGRGAGEERQLMVAGKLELEQNQFNLGETQWSAQPIELIAAMKGEFALSYAVQVHGGGRQQLNPGAKMLAHRALFPGVYRLTSMAIAERDATGKIHVLLQEMSLEKTPRITVGGSTTVVIPIPDAIKKELLGIYVTEKTFELIQGQPARFRDVEFIPHDINDTGGVRMGAYPRNTDIMSPDQWIQMKQPAIFGSYEVTLENIARVRDQNVARIHFRYAPEANNDTTSASVSGRRVKPGRARSPYQVLYEAQRRASERTTSTQPGGRP